MALTPRRQTLIRSLLFVALLLVAGGLIFYLKRSTDVPLTPDGLAGRDSIRHMAVPDTAEHAPTPPAEEATKRPTSLSATPLPPATTTVICAATPTE